MKSKSLVVLFLVLTTVLGADVYEKKRISVEFPAFGIYQDDIETFYKDVNKREDNDVSVKTSGFIGKILSNFFPKGKRSKIFDLKNKYVYELDLEEKFYTKYKLEKLFNNSDEHLDISVDEDEVDETDDQNNGNYKVLRSYFTVKEIGKTKVNKFKTTKYEVIYLLEKQNLQTEEISTDSLNVKICATKDEKQFDNAKKQKEKYYKEMNSILGFEDSDSYKDLMGMNWLDMAMKLDNKDTKNSLEGLELEKLNKIKGMPVLVDGAFYVKVIGENNEINSFKSLSNIGSLFGSKAKKKMDKDKTGYKKIVGYYIETVDLSLDKINKSYFSTPKDFKEIIAPGE